MDRRRALCHMGVGVVGIVGCAGIPTYTAAIQQKNLRLDGTEIEAALLERGAIRIRAPGASADIVLMRDADGELSALSMTCSHLGCQVRPGGDFLVCPCHGSTFDRRGAVVRGPAQKPLQTYEVHRLDGYVIVSVADI